MRIKFLNADILKKNAKRIKSTLNQLHLNNTSFNESKEKIKITDMQRELSIIYGYSSYQDFLSNLGSGNKELKDLSEGESEVLCSVFCERMSNFFIKIGMDEDAGYAIGQGLFYSLDRMLKKPSGKKMKDGNFLGYKEIAKSYGITIPALKKILSKKFILNGVLPRKKATEEGKSKSVIITPNTFSEKANLKILWSEKYIEKIMASIKVKKADGVDFFRRPSNVHDANNCIKMCAIAFCEIIEGKNPELADRNQSIIHSIATYPYSHWAIGKDDGGAFIYSIVKTIHLEAAMIDEDEAARILDVLYDIAYWLYCR